MKCDFRSRPEGRDRCEYTCRNCGRVVVGACGRTVIGECREDAARDGAPSASPSLPCVHRGSAVRTIKCELCGGNKRIVPVYSCALHGECALSRTKSGSRGEVRQCLSCKDRTEPVTIQPIRQDALRWAVGVTTAPRKQPTLARTLASLKAAGWDEIHVFAEPGVEQLPGCTWHQNPTRLSGWPNFVQASRVLSALDCDAVLLVQDDVLFAPSLREYLELTPWPKCGALSPYTAALYTNREAWGWRPVKYNGLVGALAFAIRPQVLRQLAAHPYAKKQQNNGIDTLFGKWIAKHGGLQFHHPSLCQHIGDTSTIHGRASNSGNRHSDSYVGGIDLSKIVRPPVETREPRIGLVGWNTASGLGSCNRDAARNLPISRWLVPTHDRFPTLGPVSDCEIIRSRRHDDSAMRRFLLGLDAVLFFEIPYYRGLVETARAFGVRTVGVAMAECLPPGARGWPMQVDTLICPTWDCYRQVAHVVKRSRYLPWPVDTERFRFTPRTRCERFIFAQGTGGGSDRKGGQIVAAAARLAPDVPIVVYSQMDDPKMHIKYHKTTWPAHIDLRGPVQDETTLYDAGDVSIQPSRYEGLGLSLLEAQACGLPLVTTDGEPMREYRPLRTIYSTQRNTVVQRATVAYDASPRHLADTMRELLGQDISQASQAARRYIEQERSWQARREEVLDVLLGREPEPAVRPAAESPLAGFSFRPDTWDERIWRSVARDNEYRLPEKLPAESVVLDIGAHIGSFAAACLERGAGQVHCVEPEPGNHALLRSNLERFGERVTFHQVAAGRSDRPPRRVRMHLPPGDANTAAWKVSHQGEREVSLLPFDDLVDQATASGKRIHTLKLDCEGGEWPILFTSRRLHLIDHICGEWHSALFEDRHPDEGFAVDGAIYTLESLRALLEGVGFQVELEGNPGEARLGWFWARRQGRPDDLSRVSEKLPKNYTAKNRRAIATFGVGWQRSLLALALPTFRQYAERHGYDLHVMPCESDGRPPSWGKLPALRTLLAHYEEVLWLDADTLIVDPSEDLAAGVPPEAVQALVAHSMDLGPSPNVGVWLVRRGIEPYLSQAWAMERHIHHPWWEQAAIADLLGYRLDGRRSDWPAAETELQSRTHYLPQHWNVHRSNLPELLSRPRIVHAMGAADKKVARLTEWLRAA